MKSGHWSKTLLPDPFSPHGCIWDLAALKTQQKPPSRDIRVHSRVFEIERIHFLITSPTYWKNEYIWMLAYMVHMERVGIYMYICIYITYIYVMYNILYIHHIPYLVGHIPPHFWGFKCIAYARAWRFSTIARLLPSRHRGSELGCKNSLLVQLN